VAVVSHHHRVPHPQLTVASWNVQSGRGGDLAAAARVLDADVLGVQEVDDAQPRSGGVDQTAVLAAATGAVWHRFAPTVSGTPGGSWRPVRAGDAGPRFGVSMLSRRPVLASRVLVLRGSPVPGLVVVPGVPVPVPLRDEPRVVLAADVEVDGTVVTVATAHLSFVPGWNVLQLRRALQWLSLPGRPVVLLGDLNLPAPVVDLAARGWRRLSTGPTYPASSPRVALDHALVHGAGWGAAAQRAVTVDVGDHRPVVLRLEVLASPS
jgi:endonuclease/exonuclease/phosphatase family metal-dependent hydrolase